MNKPRWADMTDDDPVDLEIPVVISKHGIKMKKRAPSPPPTYVPPRLHKDKTKPLIEDKK
jgi:hypothetical protein